MNTFCRPPSTDIIKSEIPIVKKLIEDECWYEGQRRGRAVKEHEILDKLTDILNKAGNRIKNEVIEELRAKKCKEQKYDCSTCSYNLKLKENQE